ncbi:hypothetical protein Slin15195_G057760 [Septoria linicola]|uniref:Uncharacterized protein n=1 Tax=Septoria linicola TaxID=215465 RepID=A0A9Q9EJR3_9PEZI|nr:hypothetical protein Slin14017_G073610 [Septoria linicola]USW52457.1 hypothetical protein Slin15195_G057760 [Septoria linicola]
MSLINRMTRTMHSIFASQHLRRVAAHDNLHYEYLLGEYHEEIYSNHNIYTDDGHFLGLEDEIFTPTEIAIRRSQRESQLLCNLTTPQHQPGENADSNNSSQATAGATPSPTPTPCPSPNSAPSPGRSPDELFTFHPISTPYPSFSSHRPLHHRPSNISINIKPHLRHCKVPTTQIANTLLDLTQKPAGVDDAGLAAYDERYGQQYLGSGMQFADVVMLSRAGSAARRRRGRC